VDAHLQQHLRRAERELRDAFGNDWVIVYRPPMEEYKMHSPHGLTLTGHILTQAIRQSRESLLLVEPLRETRMRGRDIDDIDTGGRI
jgi:hypothetical protein